MTEAEIFRLLADAEANVVEREEALIDAGRQRIDRLSGTVIEFLTHPHFMLRGAAIRALLLFWDKIDFVSPAMEMLRHDLDDSVRLDAAGSLVAFSEKNTDRREEIVRALAQAVAADTSPMVREEAYDGVISLTFTKLPPRVVGQFDESKIRWDVVNPYLEPAQRRPV